MKKGRFLKLLDVVLLWRGPIEPATDGGDSGDGGGGGHEADVACAEL